MTQRTYALTDAAADVLRLQTELAAAYRAILALPHAAWMQLAPDVRDAALHHAAAVLDEQYADR